MATNGVNVCRAHGANAALKAMLPSAPQRKHGRYAKLRPDLMDRFERTANDPAILSLHDDIRMINAMIEEATESIGALGDVDLWSAAKKQYGKFEVAMVAGDDAALRNALVELKNVIDAGHSDAQARNALITLIDNRKKLVESERKRHIEAKTMVTSDELITVMQKIGDIVKQYVKDPDVLTEIGREAYRVLGRTPARIAG